MVAERTVSVKLIADARAYIQGMDEAVRKTKDSTQTVEQQLAAQRDAFNQVGTAATAVGVLALAGVTAAVAAYAQFDEAMSAVQAATLESAENMDLLSDAALEAGARTVYSATESAAAIQELAKAGVSTADILNGGLNGALDLAASDGMAVAEAAEIAASAMTQFGLAGEDVTHIADLLAAGAGKAQGGVSDMGQALNQAGLVAAQMGLSIDETVGSLTAFASAGLIGSDAGTSFRAMLLRLANPTGESAKLMDEFGLSVYDTAGQFIGMEGLAGQLQERLGGLNQETRNMVLAQVFGQDAIRTSSILFEQGAEGIREWTDAVDEQGYAAETAATRLDNLKGDLEALGGAFETLMIGLGAGADGPLRGLVQGLTSVVDWLGTLDPAMHTVILTLGAVMGATALVGGAALIAVPKIADFRTALSTLNITAATSTATLGRVVTALTGPVGIAVAAATTGIALLDGAQRAANLSAEEWASAMERGASASDLFALANREWIAGANEAVGIMGGRVFDVVDDLELIPGMIERLRAQGDNFWEYFNAPANMNAGPLGEFKVELERIDAQLGQMDFETAQAGFDALVEGMGLSGEQADELLLLMPNVAAVLSQAEDASGGAATAISGVGLELQNAAEAAAEMYEASQALVDGFFRSIDTMSAYEQVIDDIAEAMSGEDALVPAVTEARDAFDLTEQAGRDAAAMMTDLVTSAQEASQAMGENGESAQSVADYQAAARDEIARVGEQMGLSEDAARAYADRLLEIPAGVVTDITANFSGANRDIANWLAQRRVMTVDVVTGAGMPSMPSRGGGNIGFAAGGRIPGYAPGFDDRFGFDRHGNVFGLGGGEFIMPTLMTDRYLPMLEQMRRGTFPGYAGGGRVGSMSNSSYSTVYGGNSYEIKVDTKVYAAEGMDANAIAQVASNRAVAKVSSILGGQ